MMRDSRLKPYPGNSPDKSAARLFLYKQATEAPRNGAAITLAGPDPREEVELLRDYLQWDPNRTWFVDHDKRNPKIRQALNATHVFWPGVNSYLGDLKDVLKEVDMVGFANLDFMGHLTSYNVLPCLKETAEKLLPAGILGLTWERGREQLALKNHSGAKAIKAGARKGRSINDKRWAGVLRIVDELTNGELKFIAGLEYQNNHSPMSVSVFRKI